MTDVLTVGVDPAVYQQTSEGLAFQYDAELRRRLSKVERTAGSIGAGAISGGADVGGEITRAHILALSVTSAVLYAGAIDADLIQGQHIAANVIGAGHINVGTLDAISADMGSLLAGTITGAVIRTSANPARAQLDDTGLWANDGTTEKFRLSASGDLTALGGTITGAIVQTAQTGARVVINSAGMRFYDAADVAKVVIDTATGLIQAEGVFTTLAGSSVDGGHLVDTSVLPVKLQVLNLAAISADLGSIQAGSIAGVTIDGAVITGGMVRTAASGARAEMTSGGIVVRKGDLSSDVTVSLPADPASQPFFAGRIIASAGLESDATATYPAPPGSKIRWRGTDGSERAAVSGTRVGYPNQVSGHNLAGLTATPGTQAAAGAVRAYATEALSYNALLQLDTPWGYWRLGYPTLTDTSGNARPAFSRGPYSVGPRNPGAADNVTGPGGGGITWKDPGNFNNPITTPDRVQSSDNSYALTASVPSGSATAYLRVTNFGFDLPDGAKVEGITVEIERGTQFANSPVYDASVKLVKNGNVAGGERGSGDLWPQASEAYKTYGSSLDLWGENWAPADIENSGFGVAISVATQNGAAARVDHIKITVHYTTGDVGTGSSLVTGGDAATALRHGQTAGAYANSGASFNPAGAFSAEMWNSVTPNAGGAEEFVLHSDSIRLSWVGTPAYYRATAHINGAWRTINTTAAPSARDHLVLTFDGSTLRFYVNGVLVGSVGSLSGTLTATGGLQIGHAANLSSPVVADELALYTTALSQAKITDRYQTGNTGTSATNVAREIVVIDSDGRSNLPVEWSWNLVNVGSFLIDNSTIPYGLDGDRDLMYELLLAGVLSGSGGPIGLRFNGDTGNNYGGYEHFTTSGGGHGPGATESNLIRIGYADWASTINIRGQIFAKAVPNAYRSYTGEAVTQRNNGESLHRHLRGYWANSPSNIISLALTFPTLTEGVITLRRKRLAA